VKSLVFWSELYLRWDEAIKKKEHVDDHIEHLTKQNEELRVQPDFYSNC
jgi:hypothetical protein